MLEKEEENNELRRKLGELIRLVEQFQDSVPEQLSEEVLLLNIFPLLICCLVQLKIELSLCTSFNELDGQAAELTAGLAYLPVSRTTGSDQYHKSL